MHSNIYLVPSWIYETLSRHQLRLVDLLSINKVRTILSMNDLLELNALQSCANHVFGTRDIGGHSFLYEWSSTALTEEDKRYVNSKLSPLASDPLPLTSIKERLFSEAEPSGDRRAFQVLPLEDRALAVVLQPGYFSDTRVRSQRFAVTREVLKQLYVYEKHTTVTALPLTLSYLGHLSEQAHRPVSV